MTISIVPSIVVIKEKLLNLIEEELIEQVGQDLMIEINGIIKIDEDQTQETEMIGDIMTIRRGAEITTESMIRLRKAEDFLR